MKRILRLPAVLLAAILLVACQSGRKQRTFRSEWMRLPDRFWIGPDYWANRLQDWQLNKGRVECINANHPKRTLHLLTRYLISRPGSLEMSVTTGIRTAKSEDEQIVYSGFLVAAGNEKTDYRRRALIHGTSGNGGGMIFAISRKGNLLLIDNESGEQWHRVEPREEPGRKVPGEFSLSLGLRPAGENYSLSFVASDAGSGEEFVRLDTLLPGSGGFGGNLALISHGGNNWFSEWRMEGTKLRAAPDHRLGPVIGTQYTLSDGVLKLTAQLAPVSESDEQTVEFQVRDAKKGRWNTLTSTQLNIPSYTATFRVNEWMEELRHDYRITYYLRDPQGRRIPYHYHGIIAREPRERDEFIVAAFTGNSNSHGNIGRDSFDFLNRMWFPHEDLTASVAIHQPDLLVYTGDNVYEGRPTPPDMSSGQSTALDYLYKWYLFLWAHGGLTRNIPAVTIPDDHDVYHGNIWGASGVKAPARPPGGVYPDYYRGLEGHWQQDQGGYKLEPWLVNMIQQTQTSHLPDAYDPAPVEQGIGVYYCNLNYGRISWAVLEDRKFKSAPSRIHPQYNIVNGFSLIGGLKGRRLDSPDASLLGERQLAFLREWAADWKGVDMKVALSQSIFANLSTYPDTFLTDAHTPRLPVLPRGVIPKDYRKAKDMDSNGWPQTGRNKALSELRKGYATMIGGDQHLGSVIHHGIDAWEDAGYSFCVPSIANLWPRRWFPPEPGENHQDGMPAYTGRYFDGFGNRVTVHAVSSPYESMHEPAALHDRAPGYGIVRLNKETQMIRFECWPRYSDPSRPDAEQYPGWPLTFRMEENYARAASLWLPPLTFEGLERRPVVQVVNEITGEILYTLRIPSFSYQPPVFEPGTYTLLAGEPGTSDMRSLQGLVPSSQKEQEAIRISFPDQ